LRRANLRRRWSTIPKGCDRTKQQHFHNQPSHFTARGGFLFHLERSPLSEIALVLVRFDHVASFIVNTNYSIVGTAV
jgi:hypothetical protein